MKNRVIPLALLGFAALGLSGCNPSAPDSQAYVDVTGTHYLELVPDVFVLHVSYSEVSKDLAQARDRVNHQVRQAYDIAQQIGIEEKAIQAANLNIQPEWEWQPRQRLIGQRVSRDITFRVNGFEQYVALMERVTETGPRNMNPGQTEVSNLGEHEAASLTLAVEDARQRAEVLASAAGRQVGKALIIQEQSSGVPLVRHALMATASVQAEKAAYSPGESRISKQVYVRFALD